MNDMSTAELVSQAITVSEVSDQARMNFLPKFFGGQMMNVENIYCALARKGMIPGYTGGYLTFYILTAGDKQLPIILPSQSPDMLTIVNPLFKTECTLPAMLAGLTATALALLVTIDAAKNCPSELQEKLIDLYHDMIGAGHQYAEQLGVGYEYFHFMKTLKLGF